MNILQQPVVYFQSDNLNDIFEVADKGFWEHTCNARKVNLHERILIGVNRTGRAEKLDTDLVGLTATLIKQTKVTKNTQSTWSSDIDEDKEYLSRYYITDIEYITKKELNDYIKGKRVNQVGLIYLDDRTKTIGTTKKIKMLKIDKIVIQHGDEPAKDVLAYYCDTKNIIDELVKLNYNADEILLNRNLPFAEFNEMFPIPDTLIIKPVKKQRLNVKLRDMFELPVSISATYKDTLVVATINVDETITLSDGTICASLSEAELRVKNKTKSASPYDFWKVNDEFLEVHILRYLNKTKHTVSAWRSKHIKEPLS